MFTSRPRRPRGAHAAPRGGDPVPVPTSAAAPPPPAVAAPDREMPPAARALGSVMSGNRRVAAAYLTALTAGEMEETAAAARGLAEIAAAMIRTRQGDPLAAAPAGFRVCLGCGIGDCPSCSDRACAHYPVHHIRRPGQPAADDLPDPEDRPDSDGLPAPGAAGPADERNGCD